jgi:hypothetical protein
VTDHPTSAPPAPPTTPPALPAAAASTLLDHLIYEQVVACIDLDELFALEQALTLLAAELDGVSPDRAADLARAMLDAALHRLPDDVRRYLHGADWLRRNRCEHCEEDDARAVRGGGSGSSQHRSTRFKV